MPVLNWVLLSLAAVIVLVVLLVLSRMRTLTRRIGSFDCRIPVVGGTPDRVRAGIAQYAVGRLDWWRFWSLSPRPARSWDRSQLVIVSRTKVVIPGRGELFQVRCEYRGEQLDLQMSMDAYSGLRSWLEAAPPVSHGNVY